MSYREYLTYAAIAAAFLPLVYLVLASLLGINAPSPRARRTIHHRHPRYRYMR